MDGKSNEWRPGPTVCRCCLSEGCYKDISTEYFWMGKREVYAEMLSETFDLTVSYARSGTPNSHSRLICEPCISRLRDAADFKRQVKECEQTFLQCFNPASAVDIEIPMDITDKDSVKVEKVKQEKENSYDDDDFADAPEFLDDDDDLDDQPLMNLATKVPKKESVDVMDLLDNAKAVKRKASKTKSSPAKRKVKEVKPSASKTKPERKKKESNGVNQVNQKSKRNAEEVLKYSTLYPFRLRGNTLCCVYCRDDFHLPSEYRQHMDENHKTFTISTAFAHCAKGKEYLKVDCTNLKCRICSLPCNDIQEIARHLCEYHDCDIDLSAEIRLQPYRVDNDQFICFLCDKKLPTMTKLCRHTTSHYSKYTCDVCGRHYLTVEALKYHIRCSHSGKFTCRKCWGEFATSEERKEHLQVSKSCWGFCCVLCGEKFKSWELKQKHFVQVHGRPGLTYACTDCDIIFNSRRPFYSHFRLNHTDEGYICPCCGLKFVSKKQMDDHRLGHTGEKHYECGVCHKLFTRSRSLKQHLWIHSETKRFPCLMCEKQFAQKVSLQGHMRSHHPEVVFED
ncbi:zinc finger protein 471-like isoform X7 [Colias croceus]|uniref:zinc finger protein 471-like isoform X7 n=1 Tax=Colias crocea TaxID=72248 RepID=UPI001E27CAD4|nr:zinc finger protein 471-like isoform X7 [Colias croceus]